MRKFIVILAITFGLPQLILGAQLLEQPWDTSRVARVALALQSDPNAQRDFLEMAAASQQMPMRLSGFHPQRIDENDEEESGDPTGYAQTPVLAEEQISLCVDDIVNNSENARNIQKVFYVDLSDFNFGFPSESRQTIFDYFSANNLYNLTSIHFRKSQGVSCLIEELFGNDKPRDKFLSLFRINADFSDISSQDIEKIYRHFSNYTYFVRDLRQINARHGGIGAFLSLDVRGVENLENIGSWQVGKKTTSNDYQILYRSHDANAKGSFIMTVHPK